MCSRGQLHQQCCEEWTLVSEETQAKMARMAAAAAWGLGNHSNTSYHNLKYLKEKVNIYSCKRRFCVQTFYGQRKQIGLMTQNLKCKLQ